MGNAVTFIKRITVRKTRRFNVHNRAERYLKKHEDKPERAPLYEATMREVERLAREMPDTTEELKKKDEGLLANLRKVYVTSEGNNKDSFSKDKVDPSAEARCLEAISPKKEVIDFVPPGKYTLEQAITIIKKYQTDPFHNPHDELAKQFNLPVSVVAKITKSVKILDFFDTRPKESQKNLFYQTIAPSIVQGKYDDELYFEVMAESNRRAKLFYERIAEQRKVEKLGGKSVENPVVPPISQETIDKLEKVYMETDIYRKTGELPPEPKLIEDGEIDKLRIEDTKKILSGETEENTERDKIPDANEIVVNESDKNKELEKKDQSVEKQKATGQT